jgi:hypothetical protein
MFLVSYFQSLHLLIDSFSAADNRSGLSGAFGRVGINVNAGDDSNKINPKTKKPWTQDDLSKLLSILAHFNLLCFRKAFLRRTCSAWTA